jgi:hypothetical protein
MADMLAGRSASYIDYNKDPAPRRAARRRSHCTTITMADQVSFSEVKTVEETVPRNHAAAVERLMMNSQSLTTSTY